MENGADDLTVREWNGLIRFFSKPQPVNGMRTKGMTRSRAASYLKALCARAEKAKKDNS